jgi:hypothetical protein
MWKQMHTMHSVADSKQDTSFLTKISKETEWLG